ncbi:MAG: hypothetical protein Ta2B_16230 [Termitinemataceae bacterium]|nr:MAG: hypothetical protein Ta2B_16230 [Termitinemataceae bacterium]
MKTTKNGWSRMLFLGVFTWISIFGSVYAQNGRQNAFLAAIPATRAEFDYRCETVRQALGNPRVLTKLSAHEKELYNRALNDIKSEYSVEKNECYSVAYTSYDGITTTFFIWFNDLRNPTFYGLSFFGR